MSAQPEKALPSATEATSTTRPDNFTFDKYSGRSKAVSEVSIRGYTSDDLNRRSVGNKRLNCGSAATRKAQTFATHGWVTKVIIGQN